VGCWVWGLTLSQLIGIIVRVTAPEQPSFDELLVLNAGLRGEIARLRAGNVALRAEMGVAVAELTGLVEVLRGEIEELKRQRDMTSHNSSKPPSSDGLGKPAPKSLRVKSGRKPGRPKGGPGKSLDLVEKPDRLVNHRPTACKCCGQSLRGAALVAVERRQVIDLPRVAAQVTEHRIISKQCRCGVVTAGRAPGYAAKTVQYGPRLTGLGVYLWHGQFLSRARAAQAVGDMFGITLAASTIGAMTTRVARGLGVFLEFARERITAGAVAFFDESGFRTAGKLHWLHSASNPRFSLYTVHPRRGTGAMDAAGILPRFTGIAVHDAWAPYDTYTGAVHALCNAHVLRELIAVAESGRPTEQTAWARGAIEVILALKQAVERAVAEAEPGGAIEVDILGFHTEKLRLITQAGIEATAERIGKIGAKHNALAKRLHDRLDDYVRYAHHPDLGFFDNNPAEREIRMPKLRIKVSGCMRSKTGAEQFAAIRSYTATARKHGLGMLDVLTRAAEGRTWIPVPEPVS
jgi:transposase